MAIDRSNGSSASRSNAPRAVAPVAMLLCVALLAAGCGSADPSTTTAGSDTGADTTGGSADGPTGELVVAVGTTGTQEFEPHLYGHDNLPIGKLFYDTLTRVNRDTQQIEGSLAESYSLSEDGLTWTFTLRPNVQFQDGWGTLTSEDVKWTWGEWIREDSLQNRAPQLRQAIDGDIDNFEIVSDLEFRLHASEPFTALPAILSSTANGLMITSKKYHEEEPETAADHPITTGPWEFVSATPGVEIRFKAFEDYWGEVPHFETLVVKEIPDGAARLVQVQSGEVDIANLDSRLINEARAADLQIYPAKDIGTLQMILGGIYPDHPNYDRDAPWIQADDPEKGLAIREAMSLAIDRQLILDNILLGEGTLNYCPFFSYPANEATTDPSWELPAYDVEEARAKLAEGGYPDGFPIEILLYPDDTDTVAVGEAIGSMWQEIGIDVTLNPSEEDLLDEKLNALETQGIAFVKQQGSDDPVMLLNNYLSSRDEDHKFHSDILDEGYDALAVESDPEVRAEIVREMCGALRDQFHPITLFTVNVPFVAGPVVGGWNPVPGDKELNSLETVTPAG